MFYDIEWVTFRWAGERKSKGKCIMKMVRQQSTERMKGMITTMMMMKKYISEKLNSSGINLLSYLTWKTFEFVFFLFFLTLILYFFFLCCFRCVSVRQTLFFTQFPFNQIIIIIITFVSLNTVVIRFSFFIFRQLNW